jgi:hypothetical protein
MQQLQQEVTSTTTTLSPTTTTTTTKIIVSLYFSRIPMQASFQRLSSNTMLSFCS